MIKAGTDVELVDPPEDAISAAKFGPCSDSLLLSSSWDSNVYLHDAIENRLKARFQLGGPLLDCCFSYQPNVAYTGGLEKIVHRLELTTVQSQAIGHHMEAVKCVVPCKTTGLLLSGSWDKTVAAWDDRAVGKGGHPTATCQLPAKVYSMDISMNAMIVGMSERLVWIYDTRNLSQPMQKRESSLKYQTRAIKAFPSGEGYVCTSIEGRVAVEFVDVSDEAQAQKYAFKCHRMPVPDQPGVEKVFPVNAVAFHPTYGTFATGGADGVVNIWDRVAKKRIKQLPRYHSSIASLSFNRDGQLLAVAASYGFEEGEKDHHPDSIIVKAVEDSEIKPKSAML